MKNPKIEICTSNGGTFLRYYSDAVFVDAEKLVEVALNDMPYLKKVHIDSGAVVEIRTPFYIKGTFNL